MHTSTKKTILNVENVNFYFRLNYFTNNTIRDFFIKGLMSPFETMFRPEEIYHILKDINLTVSEGDRLGVLGVNGAGKTTLCRCIAGMLKPQVGKITTVGDVRSIFSSSVGVVPELTGRENAELLARLIYPRLSTLEIQSITEDSCNFSELGHFLDVPYNLYSKGMQVRLCLSVISARSGDLIILDEVFDGADEFFKKKIAKRVLDMIDRSGASIFISHSTEQIVQVCNRLVVLDNSKIIYDGGVSEGLIVYKSLHK